MDFFDDLRDDEPFDDELSDEASAEPDEDEFIVDEPGFSELEFVELPDNPVPPVEMPLSAVEWPNTADSTTERALPPVPMPGSIGPAFDFSMFVGPGFGEGFAETRRPTQPRRMPFSPPADSGRCRNGATTTGCSVRVKIVPASSNCRYDPGTANHLTCRTR
jgi:hypothetical protein